MQGPRCCVWPSEWAPHHWLLLSQAWAPGLQGRPSAQLPCDVCGLPGPGIKPVCLALQGRFLTTGPPGTPRNHLTHGSDAALPGTPATHLRVKPAFPGGGGQEPLRPLNPQPPQPPAAPLGSGSFSPLPGRLLSSRSPLPGPPPWRPSFLSDPWLSVG